MSKKRKFNRNWLLLAAVGVVVAIFLISQSNRTTVIPDTIEVAKGSVSQIVFADARVTARTSAQVFSDENGKLDKISVKLGQKINKGDVVAEVKAKELDGDEFTHFPGSSIAGTVAEIIAETGENVTTQSPLVKIVDYKTLELVAGVSESDVSKVKTGQPVNIELANDTKLTGKVRLVGLVPESLTSTTPTYEVRIAFDKLPAVAYGSSADIEIITSQKTDVIKVEDVYVYRKDDQDYVKKMEGSGDEAKIVETPVTLGFEGDDGFEVLGGLKAGDKIALPAAEISASRQGFGGFFGGR